MNGTIRKLILEEKDEKLFDAIRIGKEEGMQMFNDSLYGFVTKELISRATAFEVSPNVEQLKMMLKGIDVKGPGIL
jgi:twitching motility protein PilT